jgi:hypothetical protein
MFGLFTKKPDARTQQMYGRQAAQASKVCMYLYQHQACPPPDGGENIDLGNNKNRLLLSNHIVTRIEQLDLASLDGAGKSQAIMDMVQSDINKSSSASPSEGDAGLIISILNVIDGLARHYYELYPEYKPMFEMINQLAKICPVGMKVIFGDDLPVEVRRSFPHFSSLFEQNRANVLICGISGT